MSDHSAFELLAPPIQRILWDLKWSELRPIQTEAIQTISKEDCDLIISARTASGKTEAAFLPILSQIDAKPKPSLQAVYVGPLKALINDQFRRLETLCERAKIPVHRWHGDVDAGRKKAMLENPSGVLLITPESIESLLLNRSTQLSQAFRNLEFVVIDEIHSLVGCERGTHLRSLLFRLKRYIENDFRLVALSATLGKGLPIYKDWMRPDADRAIRLIRGSNDEKRLLYKVHAFLKPAPLETKESEDDQVVPGLTESMHKHFSGKKNLIFANSKSDVEQFADALNAQCRKEGATNEFLVHHGSLSKESRDFTEREMQGRRPLTTVCSSTLELGIDIGNVSAVGQIDPPWSVGSQVQRLGRSGRGDDEPQCMRVYITEDAVTAKSSIIDRLHLDLVRSIAITELMLETPTWVESPMIARFDLSTFTHQILSVLAETGGCRAAEVFGRLCTNGAFRAIDAPMFADVLRSLGKAEVLEQMQQGDLILAPKGEQIVRHYSFYSAFASGVEYSVVYRSQPVGTLPALGLPKLNDHLLLGGRRWQVVSIDDSRKEVVVKRAKGKKRPRFFGSAGEIHSRIRETMRTVLLNKERYSYLDSTGLELIENARTTAAQSNLANQSLVSLSPTKSLWFTFTGTRIQRTLLLAAESIGLSASDQDVAIEFNAGIADVASAFRSLRDRELDALALTAHLPSKQLRKFDDLLSDNLLAQAIAKDGIDVKGATNLVDRIVAKL